VALSNDSPLMPQTFYVICEYLVGEVGEEQPDSRQEGRST
jgi:hypothetical protein